MRILVVDDDPDIASLLVARLRTLGYDAEAACDGQAALARVSAAPPDLIMLDVSMPGMTGLEVLDALRARDLDLAVVLVTGWGSEDVAIDALRRGADDYLRKPFPPEELEATLRRTVGRLELRRQNQALRHELEERAAIMEHQALSDPLTGLPNRRAFDRDLERLTELAKRHAAAFSLLMVDIDRFKRVNDTLGHAAGDDVLRTVASTLAARVRRSDVVARIGGEEFAVLLPRTNRDGALQVAEELRLAVGNASTRTAGQDVQVTISIGVAGSDYSDETTAAADAALYAAKANGRNRVQVYAGPAEEGLHDKGHSLP
jgi:two-component system, cell cycle response regulator